MKIHGMGTLPNASVVNDTHNKNYGKTFSVKFVPENNSICY